MLSGAALLAYGSSVFGRSLSTPPPWMDEDWTSFLPKMPIAPSWISTLPDQPQLPSEAGTLPDPDFRIASAISSSPDTPDMPPTGTLLDTESIVAIDNNPERYLDAPDGLQRSFNDMKKKDYRYCVYEISWDKSGLDLKEQSCGPAGAAWNAPKDFKAFEKIYLESKPGFGLFRVTPDKILSIMNFSHLNVDPCWTKKNQGEYLTTSQPCQIKDQDALPLLATQWDAVLSLTFGNVAPYLPQQNLDDIYQRYFHSN